MARSGGSRGRWLAALLIAVACALTGALPATAGKGGGQGRGKDKAAEAPQQPSEAPSAQAPAGGPPAGAAQPNGRANARGGGQRARGGSGNGGGSARGAGGGSAQGGGGGSAKQHSHRGGGRKSGATSGGEHGSGSRGGATSGAGGAPRGNSPSSSTTSGTTRATRRGPASTRSRRRERGHDARSGPGSTKDSNTSKKDSASKEDSDSRTAAGSDTSTSTDRGGEGRSAVTAITNTGAGAVIDGTVVPPLVDLTPEQSPAPATGTPNGGGDTVPAAPPLSDLTGLAAPSPSDVVTVGGEVFGVTVAGAPAVAPLGAVDPVDRAVGGRGRRADRPTGVAVDFRSAEPGSFAVGGTVREVVEVVPGPVKAALAILLVLAALLGARALAVAARARRLARQRQELLDEVGLLQAALLPTVPARLGHLVSTVAYQPAEGPAAGGDFYDAFAFDGGRVGVIVGDVAGHGRDALARTALIRYTVRAYLDAGLEPRAALKVAGSVLDDDLGAEFATVVIAVYDPGSATLTYASAGHPPPIVLGAAAHEPVTALSSPPIGAGATTGLRQTTLSMSKGSIACFFTDGMLEARVGDELMGRERLRELLDGLGPEPTAPALLEAVSAASDRTPDDMAACIIRSDGDAAGTIRVEEAEVAERDVRSGGVERFLRGCGIPAAETPELLRETRQVVRQTGSAVVRVRLGDWRPGVDVLPANVESMAGAARRAAGGVGPA